MPSWMRRLPLTDRPAEAPASRDPGPSPLAWRDGLKARLLVLLAVFGVCVLAIEARLVQLMVFQHDALLSLARDQREEIIEPGGIRGDVVDRQGRLLAYSVESAAVHADPSAVKDPAATGAALCAALGDCTARDRDDLVEKLSRKARWVELRKARDIGPAQVDRVAALGAPAVWLVPESRRYYPNREIGAHVLGFVGANSTGLGGVEARFDAIVRGEKGRMLVQVTSLQRELTSFVERAPTAGATLELTLDLGLQQIAERELASAVTTHRADGGTVIVMDPATGAVLALANAPTFNPNAWALSGPDAQRNRAVQDVYEPGSTFKIVTAAAALEEGVLTPTDRIDCSPGFITIPGRKPIADTHPYGVLSFEDVIVKSSNVGAIKAGQRIGAERLARWVRRFGFGSPVARDFSGQSRGLAGSLATLDPSGLASVSMGYQISVTPMQMAAAASAVANGGLLMEPYVVNAIVRGRERTETTPRVIRRAIEPATAAALTRIMEGVVERGTARSAALTRYRVAGKTGTSHKAVPGGYSDSDYFASFVGFVPSTRPVFTILVVIDTPRTGGHFGGEVAAPAFRSIAEAALAVAGVPPTSNPALPVAALDPLDLVETAPVGAVAVTPALVRMGGRPLMPDVRGLSGRQALRVLGEAGLTVRLAGDGLVVSQVPDPGTPIDPGATGSLRLERPAGSNGAPGGWPR
jgi:cell division protein FtsI (penicillin-binding protein 3)